MRTRAVLNMAVLVLKRAREIIEEPECWTQGAFARDANGFNLHNEEYNDHEAGQRIATDDRGVCWCPDGAIRKALAEVRAANGFRPIEWVAVQAHARMGLWDAFVEVGPPILPTRTPPTMWEWNDDDAMTHEIVLDAFDMAIGAKEVEA